VACSLTSCLPDVGWPQFYVVMDNSWPQFNVVMDNGWPQFNVVMDNGWPQFNVMMDYCGLLDAGLLGPNCE